MAEEGMEREDGLTLNEYQRLAARTINKARLTRIGWMEHALHGLSAEVGELHGLYQKEMQGHSLDEEHLMKECGDILWMLAEFCTGMGWDLDQVARVNILKLMDRYPDGFTEERSLHRKEGDV